MHPIERLRYVARASGASPAAVARESVAALMTFEHDPAGLLNACRRMVARHPRSGPMWWLASRVLTASDVRAEARRVATELDDDPTADELAFALPDDCTVCVVGWPEVIGRALVRRGDVEVLALDAHGEAEGFVRRLRQTEGDAFAIALEGLGAAVAAADVVLLEASAIGGDKFLAVAGSYAAAAIARVESVPVWLVGGVGRMLPDRVFAALVARAASDEPWDDEDEFVPFELADFVAGPTGLMQAAAARASSACPIAPELLVDFDHGSV